MPLKAFVRSQSPCNAMTFRIFGKQVILGAHLSADGAALELAEWCHISKCTTICIAASVPSPVHLLTLAPLFLLAMAVVRQHWSGSRNSNSRYFVLGKRFFPILWWYWDEKKWLLVWRNIWCSERWGGEARSSVEQSTHKGHDVVRRKTAGKIWNSKLCPSIVLLVVGAWKTQARSSLCAKRFVAWCLGSHLVEVCRLEDSGFFWEESWYINNTINVKNNTHNKNHTTSYPISVRNISVQS